MAYQNLDDGLYLLTQESDGKSVDHYGILDVGNRLKIDQARFSRQPVVVHQTPPSIQSEWLQETTGEWNVEGKIADETRAKDRLIEAARDPSYRLFSNNCEHVARYVAYGVRESRQVQLAVAVLGTVFVFALVYALSRK